MRKAKRFEDWPLLIWLQQVNPAFDGYSYMRITGDAVLICAPDSKLGSSFTPSFAGRLFEAVR